MNTQTKKVKCSRCENVFDMPINYIGTIVCEDCDPFMQEIEDTEQVAERYAVKKWNERFFDYKELPAFVKIFQEDFKAGADWHQSQLPEIPIGKAFEELQNIVLAFTGSKGFVDGLLPSQYAALNSARHFINRTYYPNLKNNIQ